MAIFTSSREKRRARGNEREIRITFGMIDGHTNIRPDPRVDVLIGFRPCTGVRVPELIPVAKGQCCFLDTSAVFWTTVSGLHGLRSTVFIWVWTTSAFLDESSTRRSLQAGTLVPCFDSVFLENLGRVSVRQAASLSGERCAQAIA